VWVTIDRPVFGTTCKPVPARIDNLGWPQPARRDGSDRGRGCFRLLIYRRPHPQTAREWLAHGGRCRHHAAGESQCHPLQLEPARAYGAISGAEPLPALLPRLKAPWPARSAYVNLYENAGWPGPGPRRSWRLVRVKGLGREPEG
jgi:hypothetical protein